ncbi:hypothetical protein TIFTF001_008415 [Ficus carica]|uniref:Uncharacterized protein n=1 Tax=Ficus carica TaxID=3494 RepID=A0AA88D0I3_FICCA|nr:hypothetical protein TIFTF001_008415 [Ficus carica]
MHNPIAPPPPPPPKMTSSPGARELDLCIRYKTMTDGFPLDYNRTQNQGQLVLRNFLSLPAHVDELVGDLVNSDPSVSCLIADTYYSWASQIARKYKLVNISLWTALIFNIYYHTDLLITNGRFPPQDNPKDTINYIPGVKAMEPEDLPSYLQETETRESSPLAQHQASRFSFVCLTWELYKKSDIDEVVRGLVLSGVNFIWVLRPDIVSHEEPYVLPVELQDEIKDKGLIVTWTNQIEVISNQAIGGFLTHCEWNSVVESLVWLCAFALFSSKGRSDHQ